VVVGEFEDYGLLRVFGSRGAGIYPTFQVLEKELKRHYGLQRIGLARGVRGRFYAISVEKKVRHPAVASICESARRSLFAG
jgi:LysR family transcriptional activator of nhaA